MLEFISKLLGTDSGIEVDEDSYFAVLEAIPVSVVITNPNLKDNPIVFCNSAFENVTGYKKSEVIGKNCRFLQGVDSDRNTVTMVKEAVKNNQPISVVLTNYKKYGQAFRNELIIVPVLVKNKVKYFVGIQNDLTSPTYVPNIQEIEKMYGNGVDKGDRL